MSRTHSGVTENSNRLSNVSRTHSGVTENSNRLSNVSRSHSGVTEDSNRLSNVSCTHSGVTEDSNRLSNVSRTHSGVTEDSNRLSNVSSTHSGVSENSNRLSNVSSTHSSINFSNNVSFDNVVLNEHTYCMPENSLSVKLVCINVCGLLSKLRYPDFEEFCQSYDIVCLVESKLGSLDSFDIQNFRILHLINRKQAKSRSGGIAVLVKDTIFEHVKILKSTSENVLWFTVNSSLLHDSVLFGAVYIPPESSSYSNISIFDSIENDILTLNSENSHKICLIGDFNAHTSNAEDFIYINEYICDTFNLDDVTKQVLHKRLLEDLGITTTRYNSDKSKIDNYGSRLLSMCKSFDIHIANGRLFRDKGIGSATCKNTTVVDYCIMSPELFSYVSNFEILPFDPLLSDIHNGIAVEFLSKPYKQDIVVTEEQITTKCKWANEKKDTFIDALDLLSLLELEHKMSDIMSSGCTNVDQIIIDSLVENCNKILLDAASESDMFFTPKQKKINVKKVKKTLV